MGNTQPFNIKHNEKELADCHMEKFAYSSKIQFMRETSNEGLNHCMFGEVADRREYVDFSDKDNKIDSFTNSCQIEGLRGYGSERFVGSGFLVVFQYIKGIPIIQKEKNSSLKIMITAAHNVCKKNPMDKTNLEYYTDLTVYNARKSPVTYRRKYKVDKVIVHPQYDGNPFCGYDIAMCLIGEDLGSNNFTGKHYSKQDIEHDTMLIFGEPSDLDLGLKLEMVGYPGEKSGRLFQHSGELISTIKTDQGGYLIAYDIDSTPGNSGSAVRITDEEQFVDFSRKSKSDKKYLKKLTVGIHIGADENSLFNYGTLITKDIHDWMIKELQNLVY